MVFRRDNLIARSGKTSSHTTNKNLTNQQKEVVNQIGDINEWKRRGMFLITFNTPILPVDTTKIIHS